jgi:hypothetical protein
MITLTLGLFIVTPLSGDSYGFHGTVYEGEGTSNPSGHAWVKATGPVTDSTRANASGQYGIQGLTPLNYYELYAWNYVEEEKWTDWAWEYLYRAYQWKDFHLNRGEPEK